MFRETDEASLGVVVRDYLGTVTSSLSEKVRLPSSLDDVEAMATIKAISFVTNLNLPSIIVEGDSEVREFVSS